MSVASQHSFWIYRSGDEDRANVVQYINTMRIKQVCMYVLYILRPFYMVGHTKHARYTYPTHHQGQCFKCVSRMDMHACSRVDCGVVNYVGLLH